MIITDEAFNNLKWAEIPAQDFNKETEDYNILGAETCTDYYTEGGEPAISEVLLYLSRSADNRVKIIKIAVAVDCCGELQGGESPLGISIAFA